MSDLFRELLAKLAAEHERLQCECGTLRAEAEALRAGQASWGTAVGGEAALSERPVPFSIVLAHSRSLAGPEESSIRERRSPQGLDLDSLTELTFLESEQDEQSTGVLTGSKGTCNTLRPQLAEAELPTKRARVEPSGTIAPGRGRVTFLEAPMSPCKAIGKRMASVFSKRSLRSRSRILTGGSSAQLSTPSTDTKLWPIWAMEEDSPANRPSVAMSKPQLHLSRQKSPGFEEAMRSDSCMQRMVIEPESRWGVGWDMVRLATLSYDVLMMPMLAFLGEEEEPEEKQFADLITTLIWTIDMTITFFSGFYADGMLEMRPGKIAKRYLQGWFWLDLPVVAIDWFATLLLHGSIGEVVNVARMSKVLRICRALRLFRVLRVLKIPRWADSVHQYLRSEASVTAFNILRSLAFIAVASHFVACGWYFVGGRDRPRTWVQALDDEDRDLSYRYTTAMHWAVTQFTPASMEVVPKNTQERVFAIVVILAAVVGFSCFLSSITQAMANLQRASMENSKQRSILRRYITQNRLSLDLGNRIMRFLRTHRLMDKRRVHEDDVQVFKLLPENLRAELHKEVYAPVVEQHPFFSHASHLEEAFAQELCHLAVVEVSLGRSEELFRPGQEASCMYFVREGLWEYRRLGGKGRKDACPMGVRGEKWVMEVALWLQWEVRGSLVAESPCEAASLAVTRFHAIVNRLPTLLETCRYYANEFQIGLQQEDSRDSSAVELGLEVEELHRMVQACFMDMEASLSSRSLPLAARTPKGTLKRLFERDGGRGALASPNGQRAEAVRKTSSM